MKLCEIIPAGAILDDLKAVSKEEALTEMVRALVKAGRVDEGSFKKVVKALQDREELGSTGIGAGVAVPHARHDAITELVGVFARSKAGIAFTALDGKPVHVLFMLLTPRNAQGDHLEALAYIARLVRDAKFVEALKAAPDTNAVKELLAEADRKHTNH